mmetsp:Transcript_142198/g.454504  ORF Transcript_142198/g.454504 Transcript_142198/m.454504 type:complete len:217 (+) Transcript_142198:1106-1756(+)
MLESRLTSKSTPSSFFQPAAIFKTLSVISPISFRLLRCCAARTKTSERSRRTSSFTASASVIFSCKKASLLKACGSCSVTSWSRAEVTSCTAWRMSAASSSELRSTVLPGGVRLFQESPARKLRTSCSKLLHISLTIPWRLAMTCSMVSDRRFTFKRVLMRSTEPETEVDKTSIPVNGAKQISRSRGYCDKTDRSAPRSTMPMWISSTVLRLPFEA